MAVDWTFGHARLIKRARAVTGQLAGPGLFGWRSAKLRKTTRKRSMMPWTMTEDAREIYYEDHGVGPVVVFVPGFMGIADIWNSVIALLNDDFRCITYDIRGYGRSEKPEAASLTQRLLSVSDDGVENRDRREVARPPPEPEEEPPCEAYGRPLGACEPRSHSRLKGACLSTAGSDRVRGMPNVEY